MAKALPSLRKAQEDYPQLKDSGNELKAYELVLEAERQAAASSKQATNLIYARIVGWLLLYPIDDNPAPFVGKVVSARIIGDSTEQVYDLGRLYMNYIIPLCMSPPLKLHILRLIVCLSTVKKHRLATSGPSTPPSRSYFDALRGDIAANLLPSPKDHKAAKALVCRFLLGYFSVLHRCVSMSGVCTFLVLSVSI